MIEDLFDNIGKDDTEEVCPFIDEVLDSLFIPKPFGIEWSDENMSEFLKKLGYKVIDGEVAIKPGEKEVPDYNNLLEVFNNEVQKIILGWLLKINTKS